MERCSSVKSVPVPGAFALKLDWRAFDLVVIGASTGAPSIIETILKDLPADLCVPIVIAQHMPPKFTKNFADHLDNASPLSVFHAETGMPLFPGSVYVGEGRKHIRIQKVGARRQIEISDKPEDAFFKPSVDQLFSSAAKIYRGRVLGIVLSGMGRDGEIGAAELKEAGSTIVTQAADTCVIYGMPKAVDNQGLSDASLPPELIRDTLLSFSPSMVESK